MNWLTNYVRPKIKALVGRSEVPENLWQKCPECGQIVYRKELEKLLWVCPNCQHHMRLGARERLAMLFDDGTFQRIELQKVPTDPLKFRDRKRYVDRLKEAQSKAGEQETVVVAHGDMDGRPAVVALFNFAFMGGSMGVAAGQGFIAAAKLAVLQKAPLIAVTASGGARMQEGILSLMQMPRTVIAVEQVKEAGLPYIVVLTDPTTGGVTASFAMLGDIALAEPGAMIGFAGSRVIEETIRESLPEGFQRSEYLLEHGMIDLVVTRGELRPTLVRLIDLLTRTRPAAEVVPLRPEEKADAALQIPEAGAGKTAAKAAPEAKDADEAPAATETTDA